MICEYNDCGWCYKPQSIYTKGCVGLSNCVYIQKLEEINAKEREDKVRAMEQRVSPQHSGSSGGGAERRVRDDQSYPIHRWSKLQQRKRVRDDPQLRHSGEEEELD